MTGDCLIEKFPVAVISQWGLSSTKSSNTVQCERKKCDLGGVSWSKGNPAAADTWVTHTQTHNLTRNKKRKKSKAARWRCRSAVPAANHRLAVALVSWPAQCACRWLCVRVTLQFQRERRPATAGQNQRRSSAQVSTDGSSKSAGLHAIPKMRITQPSQPTGALISTEY